MEIVLTVENAEALPNAAPATFAATDRSFRIGREDGDWILPDPDMFISGRHCEVRFDPAAGFWLEDVSRNGTFINGSRQRLSSPYLLESGDRLRIGRYIVRVAIAKDGIEREDARPARPLLPAQDGATPPLQVPARDARPAPLPPAPAAAPTNAARAADPFFAGAGAGDDPPLPGPRPELSPPEARQKQPDIAVQSGRRVLSPGASQAASVDILREIALGAGISPEVFQNRDAGEVAAEIGGVLRIVVEELSAMLKARAAAKMLTKSGHQTMISSAGNNPLKFVPGAEEMLEKMFSRRSSGYLDAKGSLEEAFRDLKTHEVATYAAMQAALSRLMEELSPETIEKRVPPSSFGSTRARAWDAFVKAWEAREQAHENGMLDVFLAYFSESYASASKQRK